MSAVYDEIVDFIASGCTPQTLVDFRLSDETRSHVFDLIHRQKTVGLTVPDTDDLNKFIQLEHIMRLAIARARLNAANN